jgi:hypothetical protein
MEEGPADLENLRRDKRREIIALVAIRKKQKLLESSKKNNSMPVEKESARKTAEEKAAMARKIEEIEVTRAMIALQGGPIDVVTPIVGAADYINENRGKNKNYTRVEIGVVNRDTQQYCITLSMDYGLPLAVSPEPNSAHVSRKVRVLYDNKNRYSVLASRPSERQADVKEPPNPNGEFIVFRPTTSNEEIYRDILDASQEARLTFDLRESTGATDNSIISRPLIRNPDSDEIEIML